MPDFDINPVTDHSNVGIEAEFDGGDDFSDIPKARVREGLPAKFRMRHASHYVEQLMGDAPIQTVRQIPLDQLDGPEVASDLADLVASIREVGLLQPLLVVARGDTRFHVVAGTNRLAAARQAGLRTVPCLVVNADEEAAVRLRAHTGLRSAPESEPPPIPQEVAAAADVLRTTLTEISESMRFIDALIPIARGYESSGRSSLIVDAISVEGDRATTLAAAATLFLRSEPPALAPVDCAEILNGIRAQARVAARLRGADVQWASSIRLRQPMADLESLRTGWAALIHAVLGLAQDSDRIEISLTAPRVRPAVILEVTLRRSGGTLAEDPFGRPAGAIMMAGARRSAELHGGRLSVRAIDQGFAVTFVVPQPLDLF